MPTYDIITFADTCIDILVSNADIPPRYGQVEKLIDNYSIELGGSGCLFAAQAAKLGMKVGVLGKVGADAFGETVIDLLEAAGVDTRYITIDPTLKTGMTVHLHKNHSNDRAMLTYLGSLAALTPADVTDEFLQSARHLHYASLFLMTGLLPIWSDIIKRAKGFGLTTSLDTNYDPSEKWESEILQTMPLIDVFMPNGTELCNIMHRQALMDAVPEFFEVADSLLTVKVGEAGAFLRKSDPRTMISYQPQEADPGGDSTGAGDAFDAGFLAGWLSALPLDQCLLIGCECGRSVAGKVGGYAGQLWRRDIPAQTGKTT